MHNSTSHDSKVFLKWLMKHVMWNISPYDYYACHCGLSFHNFECEELKRRKYLPYLIKFQGFEFIVFNFILKFHIFELTTCLCEKLLKYLNVNLNV
jgi:hypothetical protein